MIILVGPSASGKTVIGKYLIDTYHFKKFVTTTTRPMRINEKQNIDYHFVSYEEFTKRVSENKFVEYVQYNGFYYGSEKAEIATNKIIILEPNGLKKYLSLKDKTIVSFFIKCDKSLRKQRMIDRKDEKEDIAKRLENDDFLFNDEVMSLVNYVCDSTNREKNSVGDEIYKLYIEKITK